MLSINSHELDDMRLKLLAAVAIEELTGEQADRALEAAAHLMQLSIWADAHNCCMIGGSAAAIGDILLDGITRIRSQASN